MLEMNAFEDKKSFTELVREVSLEGNSFEECGVKGVVFRVKVDNSFEISISETLFRFLSGEQVTKAVKDITAKFGNSTKLVHCFLDEYFGNCNVDEEAERIKRLYLDEDDYGDVEEQYLYYYPEGSRFMLLFNECKVYIHRQRLRSGEPDSKMKNSIYSFVQENMDNSVAVLGFN